MPAEIALINPRRRRKARKTNSRRRRHTAKRTRSHRRKHAIIVARKINPRRRHRAHAKRHHRARRRNPRFSVGSITRSLIPAAIGGAGAVALDIALGYVPLPDMLKTGYAKVAVQIAGAFALGMIAGKVLGKDKGHAVTAGALTVAAYSLVKTVVKQAAPTLPGLAGDYEAMRMGAYMQPSLGYTNAAPSLGAYMQPGAAMSGYDGFSDGM